MTIQARTRYEAKVGNTTLILDRNTEDEVVIHEYWQDDFLVLSDPEGIDALIELLHAVKSESTPKRLTETLEPHEEIIAVEEPTA